MKPLAVYDGITRERLAFLENAYNIGYTQQTNAVWTGSFKMPYHDSKKQYCKPFNFVEIWDIDAGDDDRYIGLFRIMPVQENFNSVDGSEIEYTLEHVVSTLLDSSTLIYHDPATRSVREQIDYILEAQDEEKWILDECDYDDNFEYEFEETNLLSVLYSVVQRLTEDYYWSFDTQNFPWKLNLKKVLSDPITDVRYRKNIFGITKKIDPRSICTRLYVYGKDGLDISSINEGKPYLESTTGIANYGIITSIIRDDRFEVKQHLYDFASVLLTKLDRPFITYDANIQTIYNAANLKIGDTVRVVTEDGLDEILIIQEISKDDITNAPKSGKIIIGHGTVNLGLIVKSFI